MRRDQRGPDGLPEQPAAGPFLILQQQPQVNGTASTLGCRRREVFRIITSAWAVRSSCRPANSVSTTPINRMALITSRRFFSHYAQDLADTALAVIESELHWFVLAAEPATCALGAIRRLDVLSERHRGSARSLGGKRPHALSYTILPARSTRSRCGH